MADLTDSQAAQTVKIVGSNPSTGIEDNYAEVDSSGNLKTKAQVQDNAGTGITSTLNGSKQALDVHVSNNSSTIPLDGTRATYSSAIVGLLSGALATDILTITGSATKTIKITKIGVSGTQTTLGDVNLLFIKRSTANSGGTSTTPALVPNDSSDAAATAVVRAYTLNPTSLGTLIGTIRTAKVFVPTTSSNSTEMYLEMTFNTGFQKPIYLRGTGEVLALNLNATTVTGGNFNIWIEWVEE